jgi:hypothetical protein
MSSARSAKRDIEKARQERAAAKRERRQGAATAVSDEAEPEETRSHDEILAALAVLHERFEGGSLTFDEFEEEKAELMGSLHVD